MCESFICAPGFRKCAYGACVRNETVCKETSALSKTKSSDHSDDELNLGICRIIKIPSNGFAQYLYSPGVHLKVNQRIINLVKVQFKCNGNYRIVGRAVIVCRNGIWDGDVPECEEFCPPIQSNTPFSANCSLNNLIVNCTEPAKLGTVAEVNCKYGYESVESAGQRTTCRHGGRWQPEPVPCTQICGEWTGELETNQLPWHVTIYQRYEASPYVPVCGGTILNAKIVLSAVHCFWNGFADDYNDKSRYLIKAGKALRVFADDGLQSLSVNRLEEYTGFTYENGYHLDILLIILNEYIEFNAYTSPICIADEVDQEDRYIPPGQDGLVVGWALDKLTGEPNLHSRIIELSTIGREQCKKGLPQEMLMFLPNDKFCAKTPSPDIILCESSSGTGFVAPIQTNNKTKYYIKGVASIGSSNPLSDTCDPIQYVTLANIEYSKELILRISNNVLSETIERFTRAVSEIDVVVSTQCTIKNSPKNGFISYFCPYGSVSDCNHVQNFTVGSELDLQLPILYTCNDGYILNGTMTNVCLNGAWTNAVPECILKPGEIEIFREIVD